MAHMRRHISITIQKNLADEGVSRDGLKLDEVTQEKFKTVLAANDYVEEGFGRIAGANLHLDSETELRVYLKLDASVEADKVRYACDGTSLNQERSGDYIIVTIPNIAAHELNKNFTITAISGNNEYTLRYSVFQYAYNALGRTDVKLNNLMKAMYRYNEAALAVLNVQ